MIHLMIIMAYDSASSHYQQIKKIRVIMHHTYKQHPKIVFHSNNKQLPNHSPSFNQTNQSSDNESQSIV